MWEGSMTLDLTRRVDHRGMPAAPQFTRQEIDISHPTDSTPPSKGRRVTLLLQRAATIGGTIASAGAVAKDIYQTVAPTTTDLVQNATQGVLGGAEQAANIAASGSGLWGWTVWCAKFTPYLALGVAAIKAYNWYQSTFGSVGSGGGNTYVTNNHYHGPQTSPVQQAAPTPHPAPQIQAIVPPPPGKTQQERLDFILKHLIALGKAELLHNRLNEYLIHYASVLTQKEEIEQILKEFDAIKKKKYRDPRTFDLVKRGEQFVEKADDEIHAAPAKIHARLKECLSHHRFKLSPELACACLVEKFDAMQKKSYRDEDMGRLLSEANTALAKMDSVIEEHTGKVVRHFSFVAKKGRH